MNYRKMPEEELEQLRDEYRDAKHRSAQSFGTGMALLYFVGLFSLIGGVVYSLVDGLNAVNFALLAVGGACSYLAWRRDGARKYYEAEIRKIDDELAARD